MPETCENAHVNIWSQGDLHRASHGWESCILYFGLSLLDFLGMENFLTEITCLVFVKRVLAGAVVTPCTRLHTLNSVFLGKLMPYPVPLL